LKKFRRTFPLDDMDRAVPTIGIPVYLDGADMGSDLSTQPARLSENCPPWVYHKPWLQVLESQARTHFPALRWPLERLGLHELRDEADGDK
jgi:hypothetical protein